MADKEALELSKWMSKVAEKYNQPILLVVQAFNEANCIYDEVELSKMHVVRKFSK